MRIAARAQVFADADEAQCFYEITSGSVMLFKILPDGRRQILDVLGEGAFFGLSLRDTYGCSAQALSQAHVRKYRRDELKAADGVGARVADWLMTSQEAQREHMLLLGKLSAVERIAGLFLTDGGAQKAAHMTLCEIADYLGLRAETVSRQMTQLYRAGLFTRSRWGAYVLRDADALRKVALAA